MPTHSLDDLIKAVRSAAGIAQRTLAAENVARRQRLARDMGVLAENGAVPEELATTSGTSIGRLSLEIPVAVREVPDPDRPHRRHLALVPGNLAAPNDTVYRLTIDVFGKTLQGGRVSLNDIVLHHFDEPDCGETAHAQT
jgi:hypothetical protein